MLWSCLYLFCLVVPFYEAFNIATHVVAPSISYILYHLLYCEINECCTEQWLLFNPSTLISDVERKVIGQPQARDLVRLVAQHVGNSTPSSPLIISINGPTGTGKNHFVNILLDNLYFRKLDTRFKLFLIGIRVFDSDPKTVQADRKALLEKISDVVGSCPERSIVVIDEAEKFPSGTFHVLKSLTQNLSGADGINYKKSIFILLSTSGQDEIKSFSVDRVLKKGLSLDHLDSPDFRRDLRKAVLTNPEAERYFRNMGDLVEVEKQFFFYPLSRADVTRCTKYEAFVQGVVNISSCIEIVLRNTEFYPSDDLFSFTGCNGVAMLVSLYC